MFNTILSQSKNPPHKTPASVNIPSPLGDSLLANKKPSFSLSINRQFREEMQTLTTTHEEMPELTGHGGDATRRHTELLSVAEVKTDMNFLEASLHISLM